MAYVHSIRLPGPVYRTKGLMSTPVSAIVNELMNWQDHITVDPTVCHGRACIAGTRVLVTTILDNLAAGLDADEIVKSYPSVTREAGRASVCYAADLAKEPLVSLSGQREWAFQT